ncbi:MAG: NfeD family protein [Chitinispirillaceae bacterium]
MIMQLILPIVLQLLGVGIIIAEFILPSAGVLTILALGAFGYSLYLVFSEVSISAGVLFLVADIIIIPILVLYGIKILSNSPLSLKKSLDKGDGVEPSSQLAGAEGLTLCDLRPAGAALIEGRRRDVVTRGEYIPKGATVVVVSNDVYRIVVKEKK